MKLKNKSRQVLNELGTIEHLWRFRSTAAFLAAERMRSTSEVAAVSKPHRLSALKTLSMTVSSSYP